MLSQASCLLAQIDNSGPVPLSPPAPENRIDVYLHRTRQIVICRKSHPGWGALTTEPGSYTNTSQEIQTVLVAEFHKNTAPNGREPWHLSSYLAIINEPKYARIGWEDWNDNDYNDAMADIWITGP